MCKRTEINGYKLTLEQHQSEQHGTTYRRVFTALNTTNVPLSPQAAVTSGKVLTAAGHCPQHDPSPPRAFPQHRR